MKISVAIATYNRAPMVREAVLAALAQTRIPDEIIVSDDASTDDTLKVVEDLSRQDSRIRLVRQTRNSGGPGNCNAAVDATRGDLIAWCSDDDRFLPDHLEASAAYLEAHPEIGLVHSGFVDALETTEGETRECRRLRPASILTPKGLIAYMIRNYDWAFHPSTIVMRREVWEQVAHFDDRYQFCDSEWFPRVVEKFPVAYLPRYGVVNRRHPGNWSNRLGSAHLQREIFEIVERTITRNFACPQRSFWRAAWRANVRARLALTLWARLRSGHGDAACAAWRGMLQDTGHSTPEWVERAGAAALRGLCAGREPHFKDPAESVSPL